MLEALSTLPITPHRIRLCQSLKKIAGLNRSALISTWEAVLEQCGNDEDAISTFDWGKVGKQATHQPAALVNSDEDDEVTLSYNHYPKKRDNAAGTLGFSKKTRK